MPRVSEKALRPRQYIFHRVSPEQVTKLAPAIKKLLDQEREADGRARVARAERVKIEAARHAKNIMSGVQCADPESDTIRALERELEELKEKRRTLFVHLKRALDSDEAKVESKEVATSSAVIKTESKVESKIAINE